MLSLSLFTCLHAGAAVAPSDVNSPQSSQAPGCRTVRRPVQPRRRAFKRVTQAKRQTEGRNREEQPGENRNGSITSHPQAAQFIKSPREPDTERAEKRSAACEKCEKSANYIFKLCRLKHSMCVFPILALPRSLAEAFWRIRGKKPERPF